MDEKQIKREYKVLWKNTLKLERQLVKLGKRLERLNKK